MYDKITNKVGSDVKVVDLRTDTISRPTQLMREAMYVAEVGDDVYGEDPTVIELERRSADLLGKEDAMFVASGTMANLLAMMVHCPRRGSEVIAGDKAHTLCLEQGGASSIAGIQTMVVRNRDDGSFDLDDLRDKIKKNPAVYEPFTSLIIIENTHNLCGGRVVPLDWIEKVHAIAEEYNVPVHMDGARIMNAAVYTKLPVHRLVRDVDTICFSLSKGLGCPIGSMLAGSAEFILQARRVRKALGGGWRQAGILAAAGLVALDTMIDRLKVDHEHAYKIAKAIHDVNSPVLRVDLESVQTCIVLFKYEHPTRCTAEFTRRLAEVRDEDPIKVSVRMLPVEILGDFVRLVTFWEHTDEDIDLAITKMKYVIHEFETTSNKL